jgi:hypothetical protein
VRSRDDDTRVRCAFRALEPTPPNKRMKLTSGRWAVTARSQRLRSVRQRVNHEQSGS